ncbi:unnamed protein product [Fraxinus pennsylvanica]|uniref:Uncharacterized protein n=1 Tax=Fraxinus pennsylvanica TaxID=56036 RepID=A0AAD1YST3_9LAMI|nr:unnamed protein product [Fraxinus pennsylvanica]
MGIISTLMGFFGFGLGIVFGLAIGYFLFIYLQPTDVKDPDIRPLVVQDSEVLQKLLPQIPLWIKNPDYDRAICKTIKQIAEPIIAEQIPKYKIDSVECEKLTLGSLPPTFQGMKVYSTEEKELIMELAVKWASNPNILVSAKAFGLHATVQVLDLQVFASPRITLKPLVPSFPCFANIFVSLMEKPHVDFGLKLLNADVMSIPGLYRFVQELIKHQVANMYLWPKRLEVQIMDPAKAMKKPVGILNVKVIRAMKLKKKDLLGASDPYVKLKLSEDKLPSKKTTVKRKNLNPEWNEEFNFVVKDPEAQVLEFSVYDWEQVGSHDKMGFNIVPLKDLTPEEPKVLTLDLLKNLNQDDSQNDKSRGQLVLEVEHKPFDDNEIPNDMEDSNIMQKAPEGTPDGGGLLVVIVHEGQDLEGKHHTNPSVRLLFRGEEKRTKSASSWIGIFVSFQGAVPKMPENVIDSRKGLFKYLQLELVAVIKKDGDSIMKSVSDATRHWSAVARTIAATENKECLDLFIQLDGLHFVSKWLKDARNLSNGTSVVFVEEITYLLLALEKLHMDGQKSVSSEIWSTVKDLLGHNSSKLQNTAQALLNRWGKNRDGDTSSLDVDRVGTLNDDGMGINACVKRNIWLPEYSSGDVLPQKSFDETKCLKSTVECSSTGFDAFQSDKLENAHTSDINLDTAVMDDRPLRHVCSPSFSKPENENPCHKVEPPVCGSIGTSSVESCTPAVTAQGALDRQTDFHKLQLLNSDVKQTPNIGFSPEKLDSIEKLDLLEVRHYPSNSDSADALNSVTQPNLLKISNDADKDSCQKGPASADVRTIDPKGKGDIDDGRCTNKCRSPSASITKEGGEFNTHVSSQIIEPLEVACKIDVEREVKDFAERSSSYSEKVSEGKTREPDISDSVSGKQCNGEGSPKEVANDRDPSAGISPIAKESATSTENQDGEQMNSEQDMQTSQVTEAVQEAASTEKSPCNFDLNEVYLDDTNYTGNAISIPVSIVSASRAAAAHGFPVSPLQFEGNLGWKGSSATSAFRPASPRRIPDRCQDLSSGGSSCSSKQLHGCLHIDLNLAGDGYDRTEDPLTDKQVPVSSGPPGKFSAEANSRLERLELDLNHSSEAGDVQSDWLAERQLFPKRNDHHCQFHSSSSSSKLPVLMNIDLNGDPSSLISSNNSHLSKSSQNLNASGGIKLDDSAISIMGTRVEIEHKDFVPQFLHGTPELSFDINLARTESIMGIGSALPYAHSTSYNGLAPALSSMMYGPGGPIPYMMDSRGAPVVPQIVGCASSLPTSLSQSSFMISMTGSTASNGVVPPRTSLDLNSWSIMEGQNRDTTGFRQFLNMGQARSTDEQPRSSSPLYISSFGGKRKEPDSGWEHYPFKHRTPPQI